MKEEKHANDLIVTISTVIGAMILIISTIVGAAVWMNGKFNAIEKDIAVIKTVLIMKDIMPERLAAHQTPSEPQKHTP